MKKIAIALATISLMAAPMVTTAQAAQPEHYYLLTDCNKVVPGAIVGGLLCVVTGGVAF